MSFLEKAKRFVENTAEQAKELNAKLEKEKQTNKFIETEKLLASAGRIHAVGCKYYKANIKKVMKNRIYDPEKWFDMACLIQAEPTNKEDPNALMIMARSYTGEWTKIGYVGSDNISIVKQLLATDCNCRLLVHQSEMYDVPLFSVIFFH